MSIMEATIAVAGVQAAALGSAWALRSRENALKRQLPYVVSLAVGVLLATAILHLLPEAVSQVGTFVIEKGAVRHHAASAALRADDAAIRQYMGV